MFLTKKINAPILLPFYLGHMWDALNVSERPLVRHVSRPSSMKRDNFSGENQEEFSDSIKIRNAYGLSSNSRAYSYKNSYPVYNYSPPANGEGPAPSPHRRVSSNCINASSPHMRRGNATTPPTINKRTSDSVQFPRSMAWNKSPVLTDDKSNQDRCPEIFYSRTRITTNESKRRDQSPVKGSKKKYVFSQRSPDEMGSQEVAHTLINKSDPFSRHSPHPDNGGSDVVSSPNGKATPQYPKGHYSQQVVYRVAESGKYHNSPSKVTRSIESPTNLPLQGKRVSSDGFPRRISNHTFDSALSSTTHSSSTDTAERSRDQLKVHRQPVTLSDCDYKTHRDLQSKVSAPKRNSLSSIKSEAHSHENAPQHHPDSKANDSLDTDGVMMDDASLSDSADKKVIPNPMQASFVSSRRLLSAFMLRWINKYEENKNAYYDGGYLKVVKGSLIENRYVVIQKLGWGEFSTVWLAYDTRYYAYRRTARDSFVALKIAKCRRSVTENTTYEINLLRYLCTSLSRCPMTKLLDSFSIAGDFGNHLCMVMPLHGANLLSIIDQMKANRLLRTPDEIRMIKEIVASTLIGLHELSTINVIHTDIKPENIIATSPDPKVVDIMQSFCRHNSKSPKRKVVDVVELTESIAQGDPNHLVCLADFGLSASLDNAQSVEQCRDPSIRSLMSRVVGCKKQFPVSSPGTMKNSQGTLIQTREYRAPEVILGLNFNCQTDVWSVGCTVFELITGSFLMDPKKRTSNERQMDVEHLAMMMQLIGPIPAEITSLRTVYNSFYTNKERGTSDGLQFPDGAPVYLDRFIDGRGKFAYADRYKNYERRKLDQELEVFLPPNEARQAASFILSCLYCFDPQNRPTAKEMLYHPWLAEVCQPQ